MKNGDLPAGIIYNSEGAVLDLTGGSDSEGYFTQKGHVLSTGLTKREVFAMSAMQALLASGLLVGVENTTDTAITQADDLLLALDNN